MNRMFAFGAGAVLFALPFLQSGVGDMHDHEQQGRDSGAHMDHAPRHGGRLLMLGNHHLEIVEDTGRLRLYVSDSARQPLHSLQASVAFDGAAPQTLKPSGYALTAPRPAGYRYADYRIALAGAADLTIRLPAAGVTMPGQN